MKEIEILVEVFSNKEEALKTLSKYDFIGIKETTDIYYYDPLRNNLKPDNKLQLNECLRLRIKGKDNYIAYKVDNFDNGTWLYSDEYETKVDSFSVFEKILEKLEFKELVTIENKKYTYKYENYEIVLEEVKGLGLFLEVEVELSDINIDVNKEKEKIQDFINNLNLKVSKALNMGKPELMLRKMNIRVE